MAALETQCLRRLSHIPAIFFQLAQHEFALVGGPRLLQAFVRFLRALGRAAEYFRRQMMRFDPRRRANDDEPFDQIFQFAHIPGPGITQQHIDSGRAEFLLFLAVFLAEGAQEMRRQNRDVLYSIAQRRHVKWNHVQPIK